MYKNSVRPENLRAMLNAYMPQYSQYRLHSSLDGLFMDCLT